MASETTSADLAYKPSRPKLLRISIRRAVVDHRDDADRIRDLVVRRHYGRADAGDAAANAWPICSTASPALFNHSPNRGQNVAPWLPATAPMTVTRLIASRNQCNPATMRSVDSGRVRLRS